MSSRAIPGAPESTSASRRRLEGARTMFSHGGTRYGRRRATGRAPRPLYLAHPRAHQRDQHTPVPQSTSMFPGALSLSNPLSALYGVTARPLLTRAGRAPRPAAQDSTRGRRRPDAQTSTPSPSRCRIDAEGRVFLDEVASHRRGDRLAAIRRAGAGGSRRGRAETGPRPAFFCGHRAVGLRRSAEIMALVTEGGGSAGRSRDPSRRRSSWEAVIPCACAALFSFREPGLLLSGRGPASRCSSAASSLVSTVTPCRPSRRASRFEG